MSTHTVKQLARISGVSVRTLHYYDRIGLLRPARVGANGYRYYGEDELLRLQQILLHRELGLPLDAIASLLDTSGRSRIDRLREHRHLLVQRTDRYRELITTLDDTIANLEGHMPVDAADLYKGFNAVKQTEYEDFIVARFAPDEPSRKQLRADMHRSRAHLAGASQDDLAARMQQLRELETALAGHCRNATALDDATLHGLLARHRGWVAGMWSKPCPPAAYAGLADLYESHPDFRARYERLATGLADYLPAAMRAYSRTVST